MPTNSREMGVLATKIDMFEKKIDGIEALLHEALGSLATKTEVSVLRERINEQETQNKSLLLSLLGASIAIILSLISYIYMKGL